MNEPPFKVIKISLNQVVKNPQVLAKIEAIVRDVHCLVTHALQFLKIYLIAEFQATAKFPCVNQKLLLNVFRTLAQKDSRGRKPQPANQQARDDLAKFAQSHYFPTMIDQNLSYTNLTEILQYQSQEIVTNLETNIKQNYLNYVDLFIASSLNKAQRLALIQSQSQSPQAEKKRLQRQFKLIRKDLLEGTLTSDLEFHQWIIQNRSLVLPSKQLTQDSVYYDLKCAPQDYLPHMFRMMTVVEGLGGSLPKLFPLRESLVPEYLTLDTSSLIDLLLESQHGCKSYYKTKGRITQDRDKLWAFYFRTERRCFYNNSRFPYRFNHMIRTDGWGVSIVLVKTSLFGQKYKPDWTEAKESYVDDLAPETLKKLENRRVVGIDPNMGDLIYCADRDSGHHFRYTQDQRRCETKAKKYRKIRHNLRSSRQIAGKTVAQWEGELSRLNKKSLDLTRFQAYVALKNQVNSLLRSFYSEPIWRQLRFYSYINTQRSEQGLINNFRAKFGSPEEVVIGIGDWEQKQHRSFHEPTKGKGFRKLFRRHGYQVYLVDEWGTSSRCHNCLGGRCQTFRACQNPRPWKRSQTILRHGLLACQACGCLWNRDVNSALNIWLLTTKAILGQARPAHLSRSQTTGPSVQHSPAASAGTP